MEQRRFLVTLEAVAPVEMTQKEVNQAWSKLCELFENLGNNRASQPDFSAHVLSAIDLGPVQKL